MVCDGMEGLLSNCYQSSLMATKKNHILTPLDLFDWTSKNISNIDFSYISAEEITEHCQKIYIYLNERCDLAKVENGLKTRSHHCNTPI